MSDTSTNIYGCVYAMMNYDGKPKRVSAEAQGELNC